MSYTERFQAIEQFIKLIASQHQFTHTLSTLHDVCQYGSDVDHDTPSIMNLPNWDQRHSGRIREPPLS